MEPLHFASSDTRPHPPNSLFKYLAPERVGDVLESGNLKFTQMSNTNDIFEVRRTFERIAGPRFRELVAGIERDITTKPNLEASLIKKLSERLGRPPNRNERRAALSAFYKQGMDKQFREELALGASQFADQFNTDEAREQFLQMVGSRMLCLSLSEDFGIPPMWAHYASNNTGFVIEFFTDHWWFKNKSDASKTRLHQVHYVDGIIDEFFDNPEAAFGSKTTSWSYEKEWRMYCGPDEIEKTILAQPDPIHLVSFPSELVKSIIIGSRASIETREHIQIAVSTRYPKASIHLAIPNKRTSLIELTDL